MRIQTAVLLVLSAALGLRAEAPRKPSPAQQKIAGTQQAIEKNRTHYPLYNDLALALARRARETSDPAYYAQAQQALEKSFTLAPENFEGQKIQVWVWLGQHEFARALELAQALNQRVPDDLLVYGLLADAHIELGNYREAEEAAQWMLDLRPGTVSALTRAAYLRELFGDIDGALEFMQAAYQRTPFSEAEDRAWILSQMAHLYLLSGNADAAEHWLEQALGLFPDYHYALAQLARVRTAQQRHEEAAELLDRRYQLAPHPENLYELAHALERTERHDAAQRAYAEFEEKARQEVERADNANRELIFYYADRAGKAAEALLIAKREVARRRDVYTLDAYAWALYVNGHYAEARRQIEATLAVGIREAKLFYHAGMITAKLDDQAAATRYLEESLRLNPISEVAPAVRTALARLAAPPGQATAR